VPDRRKKMGRDAFEDAKEERESRTVERLIRGKVQLTSDVKAIEVAVRLTPSSLKHLDKVRDRLKARGREVSRDELIRIAITLLTEDDVP
jgi:translation initiation factor IF-3